MPVFGDPHDDEACALLSRLHPELGALGKGEPEPAVLGELF